VSTLPRLVSCLRSRRDTLLTISCSLCTTNPHRTCAEARRPPISVASTPEPLLDLGLALGKSALSSSTLRCFRFAFYRPKSRKPRAPAITGHGAAAVCPDSGRPAPLPHPRSNLGHSLAIQRPQMKDTPSAAIFAKEPPWFLKFQPTVQSTLSKIRFPFSKT